MVRLIVLILVLGLLVILAVQNTAPAIALVVLGRQTIALPLSVWLLGAIAAGSVAALLMYGFASLTGPSRRPYRPIGQRIRPDERREFEPERDRTVGRSIPTDDITREASLGPPPADTSQPPSQSASPKAPKSAYDTSWESFQAPERWDDWGEQPDPQSVAAAKTEPPRQTGLGFKRAPYSAADSVSEIESGWEADDAAEAEPPRRSAADQTERPTRTYESGSLYSDDASDDASDAEAGWSNADRRPRDDSAETFEDDIPDNIFDSTADLDPAQVGPDGVYEADYRVIIPPYRPLDEEDDSDFDRRSG
ncbi:MAG: hypothetical protein F6J97_08545 [Leptolyngbya sp. SIO4C1]|nr:hypothetical protein [Leptolyngbya sp. SIO4C1]